MSNQLNIDDTFNRNAAEARENGFDLLCGICGVGIHDDSDMHESWCPHAEELPAGHPYAEVREALEEKHGGAGVA